MEPASVAIGITGLIIQFVEIGKSAYELFETVQDFSGESRRLVVLVNVEKLRYDNWAKTWAHEIGLYGDASKFEERHKGQYMNFKVAIDIIAQICDLLTNVNALRQNYGLNDKGKKLDPDDIKFVSQGAILSSGAAVLFTPAEQEERARSYLRLQQRIGVTGQMKWAVRDKEKFEKLISHLREYNEALRNILPPLRQKAYDRGLVTYLPNAHAESGEEALRILANEKGFTIGQEGRDLAAAARMKYDRFQFEKGKLKQPSTTTSDIVLQPDSFHLPSHNPTDRSLVKFGNETVIMELKEISHPSHDHRKEIEQRIKDLAILLKMSPKSRNLRALDCRGLLPLQHRDRDSLLYGLVFALPAPMARLGSPRLDDLRSLLRAKTDTKTPVQYSLGARFKLAERIANSILQLHNADWLHHNVNSRNILCLSTNQSPSINYPYLSGFDMARFDDPTEVSEVATQTGDNNYRHPEYQLPFTQTSKTKFRRSYDLYSLGVILIEIGLWKKIDSFRPEGSHALAFKRHLEERVAPTLKFYMGEKYTLAVLNCLDISRIAPDGDEDRRLSDAFSRKLNIAAQKWNEANVRVAFEWVPLAKGDTFVLNNGGANGTTLARAFFPNGEDLNYVFVYSYVFRQEW